jgi:hypothetical protein
MKPYRPIIQYHRLQRYALWLLAMLSWVGAVMFASPPISARHNRQRGDITLTQLSRWVANLIGARAVALARPRQRQHAWRFSRFKRPSHFRRSLLGAKLRRLLKHRDPRAQIAQLIGVLRDLDAHAAQLAYNARHRRRRLVRIVPPIAPAEVLREPSAHEPALADSS